MKKENLLMTPGPTMVPHRVLAAEARPMIHHRTSEYSEIFAAVNEGLAYVFQTKAPILTYPAAGSGVMEAAIANFFSAGDSVLAVSIGVFGNRFYKIALAFGLDADIYDVEWGSAADPDEIIRRLNEKKYKAVLITHNETSTGANNDIKRVAELMRGRDELLIVDAVSALGALEMRQDEWGIDVVITASQKALMASPGLAFMSVSDRAWKAYETAKLPKFYWDAGKALDSLRKNPPQNPYTPAVSLIRGLKESLDMIKEEGLENIFARHTRLANATRAAVEALGLECFADKAARSDCITSIRIPEGIDGEKVKKSMANYGVVAAGGQEDLKGKVVRIGHMGYCSEQDVLIAIAAFERALADNGVKVKAGEGVTAAMKVFEGK